MTPNQIVRAWKDADYGTTLAVDEASAVPAHPVGAIELSDDDLGLAAGGLIELRTEYLESLGCCRGITQAGYCDLTAGMPGACTGFCFTIFWSGIC